MSSGKMYNETEISEFEKRFSTVLRRVEDCDFKCIKLLEELEKIHEVNRNLENLRTKSEKFFLENQNQKDYFQGIYNSHDEIIESIKIFLICKEKEFLQKNQDLEKQCSENDEFCHKLLQKISQFEQSKVDNSNLKNISDEIYNRLESYDIRIKSLSSRLQDLEKKHAEYVENLKNLEIDFENKKLEIDVKFKNAIFYQEKLEQKIDSLTQQFNERLNNELKELSNHLLNKYNLLSMTIQSLSNSKEELSKKFEDAELNSSNAILKASYNDQYIKTLEKKVENLHLLIKQIQIKS